MTSVTGKNRKWYVICLWVVAGVLLNYIGKIAGERLNLPIWLDSFGTMLTAYVLGPVCGAMVGVSVNVIYGVLFSYVNMAYGLVGMSVGIIVGICAKRRWLDSIFGTLSTGFFLTIVSIVISVPCNYIFNSGKTGNMWGDGIIMTMKRVGMDNLISNIAGQFYVDVLDKVLLCMCLHWLVVLFRKSKIPVLLVMGAVMTSVFSLVSVENVYAEEDENYIDFGKYVQTVYNGENGLPGGMANDIVQTNDGILWIGTYGGLYRYSGSQFRLMENFSTVKSVNCLYTDEAGRLWIGTNDSGIAICINQKISNTLDHGNGLGADSVKCITQSVDGRYYVGTTGSMSIVKFTEGLAVEKNIDEITYARSVATDRLGNVAAVTDSGKLYILRDGEIVYREETATQYTCCQFREDGILYVGTMENMVLVYDLSGGVSKHISPKVIRSMKCGKLNNIQSMTVDGKLLYLCADNGAGYIDGYNRYITIKANQFNRSLEKMIVDYQGNYWIASSRQGLLCMCKSVFTDVSADVGMEQDAVNCVTILGGRLFVGKDSGLSVLYEYSANEIEMELTHVLQGVRVRDIKGDSNHNIWVATMGKGIYEYKGGRRIIHYTTDNMINGIKFRSILELEDGTMMFAGDMGITYIKDEHVVGSLGAGDGLDNPKILCMIQCQDGSVLAGSDGGGIYRIKDGKVVGKYTKDDGLTSEVILRIIASPKTGGMYIITSNSMCYMDSESKITSLTNFPYYNNYDVVERRDGMLFILSSAGIFVVDRDSLLNGRKLEYILLNAKAGLKNSLTPNSGNFLDARDNLYMSTDKGVVKLNLNDYDAGARSYRVYVKNIMIDDDMVTVERGESTIVKRGASRIEIIPEIINYSVNDPYIQVWLEGFDSTPRVVRQSELTNVVYTNLRAGTYVFHIGVLDSKGQGVVSESLYVIEREREIYDYWWFRLYAVLIFVFSVFYLAWLIVRTRIQRTIAVQKRELEVAKYQVAMGNETVLTIAKTVDTRDANTSQHSKRVSDYSVMIARKLGFNDAECEKLRKTALLHDIGKIGIPDRVLNKTSGLSDEEYELMKSHVVKGAEILKTFTLIEDVQEGALYHHERYDGKGYIHGLKGDEIPLNARIIGIADAFDAMTANRVYRKKLNIDYVIGELKKGRGTQFDPKLVDIMLGLIEDGSIDVTAMYNDKEEQE